jgi:hypothetical protein
LFYQAAISETAQYLMIDVLVVLLISAANGFFTSRRLAKLTAQDPQDPQATASTLKRKPFAKKPTNNKEL